MTKPMPAEFKQVLLQASRRCHKPAHQGLHGLVEVEPVLHGGGVEAIGSAHAWKMGQATCQVRGLTSNGSP